jgi:hypothetical protein
MTRWCALDQIALNKMQWQTVAEAKAEDKVERLGFTVKQLQGFPIFPSRPCPSGKPGFHVDFFFRGCIVSGIRAEPTHQHSPAAVSVHHLLVLSSALSAL